MTNRLANLHAAAHRATLKKTGVAACRICGGRSPKGAYCLRHFRSLSVTSKCTVKSATDLAPFDEEIRRNEGVNYQLQTVSGTMADGVYRVHRTMREHRSYFITFEEEREVARVANAGEVRRWIRDRQHAHSAHNRFARKTVIG